jgi:hypothetical protein
MLVKAVALHRSRTQVDSVDGQPRHYGPRRSDVDCDDHRGPHVQHAIETCVSERRDYELGSEADSVLTKSPNQPGPFPQKSKGLQVWCPQINLLAQQTSKNPSDGVRIG